jgi:hypothetical protein
MFGWRRQSPQKDLGITKRGRTFSRRFVWMLANLVVTAPNPDPATVVQRQLDAYNARDIDGLMAIYAADAGLYEHPDKLLATGTAALRERFAVRFQEPNLHAALLHRVVAGDIVIDHERVTRTFAEGPGTLELVMIYEIKAGRIIRAWTIPGRKVLAKGESQP